MDPNTGRALFLDAAHGQETARPPVWMMRQAGRYLPEYRDIRADHSFTEAISTPSIAETISLQPFERFQPDGVVMYSDILTALEPMGIEYHIESGVGPVIENPIADADDVGGTNTPIAESLDYVGELLGRLSHRLGDRAAVIGFVGGPFTLAAYAVEGTPARAFTGVRRLRYQSPEAFRQLLGRIGDVLEAYIAYQVESGADVVQLFDTYAGLLTGADYREFLLPVHQRLLDGVDVPTIIFARNMGDRLELLQESGADVVGVDWTVDMATVRAQLGEHPVQGNLDPAALYGPPDVIRERTQEIIEAAGGTGHIMNLGHGIDKHTPVEHVEAFFDAVHSL